MASRWRVSLARAEPAPGVPPEWFSASERERFVGGSDARRAALVSSRALLRHLLCEVAGGAPTQWRITATSAGPPRIESAPPGCDDCWHLSLSHRRGWVAAAVGPSPLGVDVEVLTPTASPLAERADLVLSPEERSRWNALPETEQSMALLRAWTAKEAYTKACHPADLPWLFSALTLTEVAPAASLTNTRIWSGASLCLAFSCADPSAWPTLVPGGEPIPFPCSQRDAQVGIACTPSSS